MRLTPYEHQQAVDFVLVPELPNSRTRTPGKRHRIAAGEPVHVSKAMTVKSNRASQVTAVEKGIAARPIDLTQ
jgi:hypothetical protein